MSYFGKLYNRRPVSLIEGVVQEFSINQLYNELELAFDNVSNLLGNLHGQGIDTAQTSQYINSLASALGGLDKIAPEEPFGALFSGYTQQFNGNNERKDFVLDLFPVQGQTITIGSSDTGIVWNQVEDEDDLVDAGDFLIRGRRILFFRAPTGSFTVTYNGNYPSVPTLMQGYAPNVYPAPSLIAAQPSLRPALTSLVNGRIRATFTPTNRNQFNETYPINLSLQFSTAIAPYVSAVGSTPCPQDLVSAWIREDGVYRRLNTSDIYIISNTEIQFETDEEINPATDVVVFSISNVTISDMVRALYTLITNHTHDANDVTAPIDHSRLSGLLPSSSRANITYGLSRIINNDHPHYLHREGYRENDPGSYNNALLGDLLISSTDQASLFNNINADSHRLVFGATTDGVSLKYRSAIRDLLLYSASNGLSIRTNRDLAGNFALDLDGHKFFSQRDIPANKEYLCIAPRDLLVKLVDPLVANQFSDLQLKSLIGENAYISRELSLGDDADFKIGRTTMSTATDPQVPTRRIVNWTPDQADSQLDIQVSTRVRNAQLDNAAIGNGDLLGTMDVGENGVLAFNGGESTLEATPDNSGIQLSSSQAFRLARTGIHTGISSGNNDQAGFNEYVNVYAADPSGNPSTPTTSRVFMEAHDSAFHVIKSTRREQYDANNNLKRWKSGSLTERVDYLTQWPHADFYASAGNFRNVVVELSSLTERKGVSFGPMNHIYVTGADTRCPTGWVVVESQNGVVLVESRSNPIDCENMSYAGLTCGSIEAYGNVTVRGNISAGEDIVATRALRGLNVAVDEDATIGGAVQVGGGIEVRGLISGRSAEFNGSVQISDVLRARQLQATNIIVEGLGVFREGVTFEKGIDVLEPSRFRQSVAFEDDILFQTDVRINNNLTCSGVVSAGQLISNQIFIAEAGIQCNGSVSIRRDLTAESIGVERNVNIGGALDVSGMSLFRDSVRITDNVVVDGSISVSGEVNLGLDGSKTYARGELEVSRSLRVVESAEFLDNMTVSGDMQANVLRSSTEIHARTSMTVGATGFTTEINGNNINVTGNNGNLTVSNANINSLSGNSPVEMRDEVRTVLQTNHGSSVVSGFIDARFTKANNMFVDGRSLFKGNVIFEDTLYVRRIESVDNGGLNGGEAQNGRHWIDVAARVAYYA